jgi:hypothetical protein
MSGELIVVASLFSSSSSSGGRVQPNHAEPKPESQTERLGADRNGVGVCEQHIHQ